MEVIATIDLVAKLKEHFPEDVNDENQIILEYVFENRQLKEKIVFDELVKVMKSFGIREDLPRSLKHLNYEMLDLKSKRILNRVSNYLAEKEIDFNEFFNDLFSVHNVKTKTKTDQVEIMKAELFFKKLSNSGIK